MRLSLVIAVLALAACGGRTPRAPWPAGEASAAVGHAEVSTLNSGYQRLGGARVLVREVARPTRANLDYAAYAANFLIADAPPEPSATPVAAAVLPAPGQPLFAGTLDGDSLTGALDRTALSPEERTAPLALAPLAEWLASRSPKAARGLEDLLAAVREEAWGAGTGPLSRQSATLGYLHRNGDAAELWVKIEFQPWWKGLADLPDQDGDGVPEIYGRARAGTLSPEALSLIDSEYAGAVMDAAGVASWGHKLASYWYPSYNTDLVTPGAQWPDADTEPEVRAALGDSRFAAPAVIVRGKPEGKPVYNVFLVKGQAAADKPATRKPLPRLSPGNPTPAPKAVADAIAAELAGEGGGTWQKWERQVQGFHAELRRQLKATPAAVKGLTGEDGFLFYRNGFDYIAGGDLERQKRGKNPLPIIIEWKELLARQGVDFLFVPVPDKAEVFADKVAGKAGGDLVGKVVNPWGRKLLADLSRAGVETIDLLRPYLDDRKREPGASEPLFQRQDTHWTPRGMAIAADAIAARIKRYPWYGELKERKKYGLRAASFKRYGDLHARLPDAAKKNYQPEALTARQVVGPDGALYVDDPDSPVVVLGDSFTGVLELTDCEHAGVSAHLARHLGVPVDLVMSYGGGPNVRHKLMRRGVEGLASKRLVVWIMTARDLYNYWENWEPLAKK